MSAHEDIARAALAEITPVETVGALLDSTVEDDGVVTLSFAASLSGYPGWHWSVSVAALPDEEPTVLEAELLPGEGALLAPDWVPWAERLEEYRAAQAAAAAEQGEEASEDDDSADESDEDDDESDEDDDESDEDDDDFEDDDYEDVEDDDLVVSAGGDDEQDESDDESGDDGPEQPDES
jgi:Nucleosome binding factor SPN, SPT16 subunit